MAIRLKYRFKRLIVRWRQWKRSLNNSIKSESSKLTPAEEKGIRLWKITIKDEDSELSLNSVGDRQVEKESLFIIVNPQVGSTSVNMTIINITDIGKSLYELRIDGKHAESVIEAFDTEMDKRMRKRENSKRILIENDIDKLIEEEEKCLKKIQENKKLS